MPFHVVVGAGATGTATARLLAESGDQVRLVSRRGAGPGHPLIDRVAADASDPARLRELTAGAATLINCAMPPYDRWPAEFPPLAAALLAAAEHAGAGYVMLGNIYGYGPVDGPVTEQQPLAPNTEKGRVRARMWNDVLAAHNAGRVRVAEVRAIDYLGAGANSLYNLMVTTRILAGEPASYPADLDVAHSWSYIGDVARTLVAVTRSDQAWGRAWHVPSVSSASARELTELLADVTGAPAPKLLRMSAVELHEIGLAYPVMAEVSEMLYLYERPAIIDSALTEQAFGLAPSTLNDVLIEMATEPATAV
jgi:nucleoside-diphosphate-sugar epimerase